MNALNSWNILKEWHDISSQQWLAFTKKVQHGLGECAIFRTLLAMIELCWPNQNTNGMVLWWLLKLLRTCLVFLGRVIMFLSLFDGWLDVLSTTAENFIGFTCMALTCQFNHQIINFSLFPTLGVEVSRLHAVLEYGQMDCAGHCFWCAIKENFF